MTWEPVSAIYKIIDERIEMLRIRQSEPMFKIDRIYWFQLDYAVSQLRQLRKDIEEAKEVT